MDGLSVAKIRTSLVQCLRGYSVNGFGLQRKKDAGGPYQDCPTTNTHSMFDTIDQIVALAGAESEEDMVNTGHEDIDLKDDTAAAKFEIEDTRY